VAPEDQAAVELDEEVLAVGGDALHRAAGQRDVAASAQRPARERASREPAIELGRELADGVTLGHVAPSASRSRGGVRAALLLDRAAACRGEIVAAVVAPGAGLRATAASA
jgi:hypothetical protein